MTGGTVPKSSSFSYQVTTPSHHLTPAVTNDHVALQTRAQDYGQHAAATTAVAPAHGRQREELSHFMEQVGTQYPHRTTINTYLHTFVHLHFLHIIHVSGVETRAGQPGQQLQPARREGEGGHGVQGHVQIYLDQGGIT